MWLLYLLQTAVFTYLSFLLGKLILSLFKWRGNALLHTILAITIGYGGVALIGLILALIGWLNQGCLYIAAIIIIVLSYKTIVYHLVTWTTCAQWKQTLQKCWHHLRTEPVPFILMTIWIISYAVIALSPTAMGKDGLAYHLPFSAEISQYDRITFPVMADPEYGQLPLLGEVLNATTLTLFDNLGVMKLLQYVALLLLVAGIGVVTHGHLQSRRAFYVLMTLLLACMPIVRDALSGAMIDIWAFLFGILGIFLTVDIFSTSVSHKELRQGLIVSGILIGLALGTKYLSLFLAIIVLVEIILISALHKKRASEIMKLCLAFVVPALVVGGFWYVKNLILAGNPFFPIFASGGGAEFTSEVNAFVLHRTWYNFILFPFYIFGKSTYHLPFGIFTALCFALTYASFIFCAIKKRLTLVFMALFVALEIYLGFVFMWSHQIRFIVPALILNACLAVMGSYTVLKYLAPKMGNHERLSVWVRRASTAGLALFICALFVASAFSFKQELRCLSSSSAPACYARVEGGAYYATQYINEHFEHISVIEYFNVFYHYSMRRGNTLNAFFCTESDERAMRTCLEKNHALYYLDDTLSRRDPWIRDTEAKLRTAKYFVKNGTILFEYHDPNRNTYIRLYSIK